MQLWGEIDTNKYVKIGDEWVFLNYIILRVSSCLHVSPAQAWGSLSAVLFFGGRGCSAAWSQSGKHLPAAVASQPLFPSTVTITKCTFCFIAHLGEKTRVRTDWV